MRTKIRNWFSNHEKGQSLVLLAFLFVGLIAFVGLAVDAGLVFVRNSQLQTAVDAAVLAGVVELTGPDRLAFANERAAEFMHSHNLPTSVITSTFSDPANYWEGISPLGAHLYAVTATWPVDLFFLPLIGWDTVSLTNSAMAAHFPLADIYASRRVEDGALTTSSQGLFGPDICVEYGDPFSSIGDPRAVEFREKWRGDPNDRAYHYRILIPPDYPSDILRVELFDPDSINQASNDANVVHTNLAQEFGDMPAVEPLSCTGVNPTQQKNPCLIETGEEDLDLDLDVINPWWIMRIDENRGAGPPPGNPLICDQPGSYTVGYNTITYYELFYWKRNEDGSLDKVPLAHYWGQSGDMIRDNSIGQNNGQHLTDLRWVSPGGRPIFDQPAVVPAGCGSPNGGDYDPVYCPGGSPPGPGSGFEIEISNDLPDILTDGNTGARFVYLDVTTVSGAAENGYEIWAGPPDYVNSISSDVNLRNVQVINQPNSHSSLGASVFGIGHLPMNSMYDARIDIPLIYVGPEYAGTSVFVTHYDSDSGASPPITFYFDSIAQEDWSMTFAAGDPDPDGVSGRCVPGSCGTQFVDPPYEIYVPTLADSCTDPSDPDQKYICTPFYGGRLMVSYDGGQFDTYHWNIKLSGLPWLIR